MALPPVTGKRVLVIAPLIDGWLFFYTKTLSNAGYDVTLVTNTAASVPDQDHANVLHYFSQAPFCPLIDIADEPAFRQQPFDFAVTGIHGATSQADKSRLLALIGATPLRAVVFRRYNTRFPAMAKLVVKEVKSPFLRRSSRVMVEGYQNASFLLNLLSSADMTGIVPHQRVTCRGLMDGVASKVERDYLFNFLGAYDADPNTERTAVVDELEARYQLIGGEQDLDINGKKVHMIWYADRPGSTRKRPMEEYFARVGNSYFTLCPSGDSETAHRVLEAIHCGSIPVINAQRMPQYGLPLVHGKNCWLVRTPDWTSAVIELSDLDREKILAMQAEVKKLAQNEASISALEKKCLANLGLTAKN